MKLGSGSSAGGEAPGQLASGGGAIDSGRLPSAQHSSSRFLFQKVAGLIRPLPMMAQS